MTIRLTCERDVSRSRSKRLHLSRDELNASVGTIRFPFSSMSFVMSNVAKMDATTIHRKSKANHLPGHMLKLDQPDLYTHVRGITNRRPNPKAASGMAFRDEYVSPSIFFAKRSGLNAKGSGYTTLAHEEISSSACVEINGRTGHGKCPKHWVSQLFPCEFCTHDTRPPPWQSVRDPEARLDSTEVAVIAAIVSESTDHLIVNKLHSIYSPIGNPVKDILI